MPARGSTGEIVGFVLRGAILLSARHEILTAGSTDVMVFAIMTPCNFVDTYGTS
jgi:hypothetical protein